MTDPAIDRAARVLLEALDAAATAKPRVALVLCRLFSITADGLDQAEIVHRAAWRLRSELPNATLVDCEAAVWADVLAVFGWRDLRALACEGNA